LACDHQAGAEQLVDLQAKASAASGSAALKRSGDVVVERQRGSHCRTVAPRHHNINIVMQRHNGELWPPGAFHDCGASVVGNPGR